jgi:hypothetical protein
MPNGLAFPSSTSCGDGLGGGGPILLSADEQQPQRNGPAAPEGAGAVPGWLLYRRNGPALSRSWGVLGTRQSGLPDFALASLIEDQDVLMLAREAAEAMLKEDPDLNRWPKLAKELQRRYEKLMGGAIMT